MFFLIYNGAFVAQMAKLVDALVSGTSAARRGGSSPLLGTKFQESRSICRSAFCFVLPLSLHHKALDARDPDHTHRGPAKRQVKVTEDLHSH